MYYSAEHARIRTNEAIGRNIVIEKIFKKIDKAINKGRFEAKINISKFVYEKMTDEDKKSGKRKSKFENEEEMFGYFKALGFNIDKKCSIDNNGDKFINMIVSWKKD